MGDLLGAPVHRVAAVTALTLGVAAVAAVRALTGHVLALRDQTDPGADAEQATVTALTTETQPVAAVTGRGVPGPANLREPRSVAAVTALTLGVAAVAAV